MGASHSIGLGVPCRYRGGPMDANRKVPVKAPMVGDPGRADVQLRHALDAGPGILVRGSGLLFPNNCLTLLPRGPN